MRTLRFVPFASLCLALLAGCPGSSSGDAGPGTDAPPVLDAPIATDAPIAADAPTDDTPAAVDAPTDDAPTPDAPVAEVVCGGRSGPCAGANAFCDFASDGCDFADATGVCRPRPDLCTDEVAPVCGCDGNTYSNECQAHAAGTDRASDGPCGV